MFSILASVLLTILGIVSSLFNKILMDEILPYKLKNTLLLVLIIFAIFCDTGHHWVYMPVDDAVSVTKNRYSIDVGIFSAYLQTSDEIFFRPEKQGILLQDFLMRLRSRIFSLILH